MNKVTWFEIPFDNAERFQKFYSNVFGWNFEKISNQNYFRVNFPNEQDAPITKNSINGGFYKRESDVRYPMVAIHVESIEDCFEKIEKFGGQTILPKKPIPEGGFYARFVDSEQNIIEIWENSK